MGHFWSKKAHKMAENGPKRPIRRPRCQTRTFVLNLAGDGPCWMYTTHARARARSPRHATATATATANNGSLSSYPFMGKSVSLPLGKIGCFDPPPPSGPPAREFSPNRPGKPTDGPFLQSSCVGPELRSATRFLPKINSQPTLFTREPGHFSLLMFGTICRKAPFSGHFAPKIH